MRRRLRLPLAQLGQIRELQMGRGWVWHCLLQPCTTFDDRHPAVGGQEAAQEALVAHLRDYHDASGGELTLGRRARKRAILERQATRERSPM